MNPSTEHIVKQIAELGLAESKPCSPERLRQIAADVLRDWSAGAQASIEGCEARGDFKVADRLRQRVISVELDLIKLGLVSSTAHFFQEMAHA